MSVGAEKSLERLESLLSDIRERIERLETRLQPEPMMFTIPEAAARLGIGQTKLKEMLRKGQLRQTGTVGRVKMIPLTELQRVATPEAARPKVERAARSKAWQPIAKRR